VWRKVRSGTERAHFLHLGKTGGTAIKAALAPFVDSGPYTILLHPHHVGLREVPRNERFFFAVRDPADRFVSGFYSRQRQGMPRYHEPWTPEEAEAFRRFSTANALAVAISADDPVERRAAQRAMRDIEHVRDSYSKWFPRGSLRRRKSDLLYVLLQSELDEDFVELVRRLGLEAMHPQLPEDDLDAHRNPSAVDRRLSARALENLQRWYARDYGFFEECRELRLTVC
jgi:hypothetical protein